MEQCFCSFISLSQVIRLRRVELYVFRTCLGRFATPKCSEPRSGFWESSVTQRRPYRLQDLKGKLQFFNGIHTDYRILGKEIGNDAILSGHLSFRK